MEIVARLESLRRREHEATVELIEALVECHRARAHVDAGYRTVFRLLVERLSYSPAAASRRFAAMRCALRSPRVLHMLRAHRTSLSALAKIAPLLDDTDDVESLLAAIDGRRPDEIDAIVAGRRPIDRPAERVRPIAVKPPRAKAGSSREGSSGSGTLWGCSAAERTTGEVPAERTTGDVPTDRTPAAAGLGGHDPRTDPADDVEPRVALSFTLSKSDHAEFERARAQLSRTRRSPLTLEETLIALVGFHARHRATSSRAPQSLPRATTPQRPSTRHVPKAVRDHVFERDAGRCTFVAADGTRCTATHDLQIDHVQPFALGGSHDPSNLRLLCAAHNRRRAEITFGRARPRATHG